MVETEGKEKLIEKLTKQVEFYLSDDNLKRDKYFNDLIRENKVIP